MTLIEMEILTCIRFLLDFVYRDEIVVVFVSDDNFLSLFSKLYLILNLFSYNSIFLRHKKPFTCSDHNLSKTRLDLGYM